MKQIVCILFSFFLLGLQAQEKKETLQEREQRYNEEANPFKQFGYKPRIITLSKGKYKEFFTDTIVQIGSFTYNRLSKKIIGVVKNEGKSSESSPRPDIVSRWMSPDPLSEEFPSWSPYNFVNNNPIYFNDPTGLAPSDRWQKGTDGTLTWVNNDGGNTTDYIDTVDKNGNVTSTQTLDVQTMISCNGCEVASVSKEPGLRFVSKANGDPRASSGSFLDAGSEVLDLITTEVGESVGIGATALTAMSLFISPKNGLKKATKASGLVAKGLGSTGRTTANNLVEQMAMKSAMANPQLGRRIMEGMTDTRWAGWTKMQLSVKTQNGVNAVIHYVGKWEKGVLKAVDDFKFK